MSRAETIKAFVRKSSKEGEALAYPDHPLVLEGPSVLRLVNETLTASFVYTQGSRPASSIAEQARVLLARLAFPGHTVFEAIFEVDAVPKRDFLNFFDTYRVVTSDSMSQPDGDDETRAEVASAVENLRGFHLARFAANQVGKPQKHPKDARASFMQFSPEVSPSYKFVDKSPKNLSADVPRGTRALTISRIQRVAETFIASDYGLGHGVYGLIDVAGAVDGGYYLGQHPVRTRLNQENGHNDMNVSKPLRAAQFAGGLVQTAW